jgi:hypothetical protein
MIENQIGRRNLTQDQLSYYRGFKYLSLRKKKGGFGNIKSKGSTKESTALWLSKEFNVSESTIKRNAKFAEILNLIEKADPTLKSKILMGKIKVKRSKINALTESKNGEELIRLMKGERRIQLSKTFLPTSLQEEKLKKIRGMIIGTINRAILNKSTNELKELKSLILKFELELLEPANSVSHSMSVSEKSNEALE